MKLLMHCARWNGSFEGMLFHPVSCVYTSQAPEIQRNVMMGPYSVVTGPFVYASEAARERMG